MSSILYYSNFCEPSKKLIKSISNSGVKNDMHFLCIDKREIGQNNCTYIILENSQRVVLPPTVTKVPALLLLNQGHQVLFGEQIYKYIQPKETAIQKQVTFGNNEPQAYGINQMNSISDCYSFLDQSSDELSAKGDGGLRQLHNYVTINENVNIATPPDDYEPDKIGNISLEKLQEQRNNEIPSELKRI